MRWMRMMVLTAFATVVLVAGSGCTAESNDGGDGSDRDVPSPTATEWIEVSETGMKLPPFGAALDYQLGGSYPVDAGVGIVTRDSTEKPEPDVYSICYVNGFQSQPGDDERWIVDNPDLVLRDESGDPMIDENWPDEIIFDTSTAENRKRISRMIGDSINTCAESGFAAVEIDNLDSYSRSNGRVKIEDNLALAALFSDRAHGLGLAIGQKNSAELGARGHNEARFDFAVTEECMRFEECAAFSNVYGAAVMDIEYTDDLPAPFAEVCASADRPSTTTLRDRDLVTRGAPGYAFEHC